VINVSLLVLVARSDPDSSPGTTTPDQRLRVFVSSSLGELKAERRAARAAIDQLRLTPVMFEPGAHPQPAREVYQAYLEQSDIFVGIYWQSYGGIGPDEEISGLESEFQQAGGIPRLVYVKRPAPRMEPGLSRMLGKIKSDGGLTYKPFAHGDELRELLLDDLARLVSEHFAGAGRPGGEPRIPAPVTALVGRDRDVAEVASLVTGVEHRLVVLTGPGGVGKTRLALAVLEQTRAHWEDGVAFADLSAASDPSSVPDAIAAALGLAKQGQEAPRDTLARRLAGRHMLIVLDNCDQVLDAVPLVPELLERAPRLHLLVTSRVVLRVRGEREWRVEPLGLQPGDGAPAPAVRLFADRIRDASPGFELTSENTAAIAEVCRRLDGLPLALELAASWLRLLTPQQLLERLDERMRRPAALVDLPDRQQTMTATIESSYQLLSPAGRRLLARLTVFAAPFTADAVEAVSGHDAITSAECLELLLEHNMVRPAERPDGARAFAMLMVIHHFAADRLDDPDDPLARMESYLLGVLERASAQHGAADWARRLLDSEAPNLEAALQWSAERQRSSGELLRRIGDVWKWLLIRGHLRRASGLFKWIESWPAAALGSEDDTMARNWLRTIALLDDGQFTQAATLIDEILPDARRLLPGPRSGLLLMVRALARPYTADSPARGEFEEALAVTREAGDPVVVGYVLSHFGLFLCVDGDPDRARALHEEVLGIAHSLRDDNQGAEAHYDLAMDALAVGDPEAARSHLATAADWFARIDHREGLARCLGALAAVALRCHHPHLAARLVGTAEATRAIGLAPWPSVAEAESRVTRQIRAALPGAELAAASADGRADTAEAALARAQAALGAGERAQVKPGG